MASLVYLNKLIIDRFNLLEGRKENPSSNTIASYKKIVLRYVKWAKKNQKCRTVDQLEENIPKYLDSLLEKGRAASTLKTYKAALCYVFELPMADIDTPACHTAENTRSRGVKAVDSRSDAKREVSPRLYDFAEKVGIRRAEYGALRHDNFKIDESGYPCVEVKKGKGGKYQLQRIPPQFVAEVMSYFNGSHDYLFSKAEMNNKLDLHALRGGNARSMFHYYDRLCQAEPQYRKELEHEIKIRWETYNKKKKWNPNCVRGTYILRGKNRKLAKKLGLPLEYDRLAVMAVSVFHLSHWRCNVAINNYLLAK